MNGADVIGALLRGHAPLTAAVPPARIKGGCLPADTPLPALLVRTISSVEREQLKAGASVPTVDRVSVTVRAASWGDQLRIIDLVADACRDRRGAIAGLSAVAVLLAGRGPDLAGPGDSFEQAQDLRVSFNKPVSRGE